ncbi:MAG: respiratory nitrate reductase subunit gamma [Solirubrobacteraceae bacterium]|nr:respiratory nitrate reductase subunit gamma [Solirubrobacteraceae bacterium]
MSAGDVLLWIILPYVALATFVVGHWWRYRTDRFGWGARSTQLLERRILGWASPAFHFGILAAAGGHVIGLVIPASWTASLGISENAYHWFAAVAGGLAGLLTVVGFVGLLYRRTTNDRVRRTTTPADMVTYGLLTFLVLQGTYIAFGENLLADDAHHYRDTMGAWWRSLFALDPDVDAAVAAPFMYQLHAVAAWAFWAFFPFSRLVHVWSLPWQYIGRPPILYRRRFATSRRAARRGAR